MGRWGQRGQVNLLEAITVGAIVIAIAGGAYGLMRSAGTGATRANLDRVAGTIIEQITEAIKDKEAWPKTLAANSNMNCLKPTLTGTKPRCDEDNPDLKSQQFTLINRSGETLWSPTQFRYGVDQKLCAAGLVQNMGDKSDACPFQIDLQWKPMCKPGSAGNCDKPQVLVSIKFSYLPSTMPDDLVFNGDKFSRTYNRESEGLSMAAFCRSLGHGYDADSGHCTSPCANGMDVVTRNGKQYCTLCDAGLKAFRDPSDPKGYICAASFSSSSSSASVASLSSSSSSAGGFASSVSSVAASAGPSSAGGGISSSGGDGSCSLDGLAPGPNGCCNVDTDLDGLCGTQGPVCAMDGYPPGPNGCCNVDSDGNGVCGFQCIANGLAVGSGGTTACCNGDADSNGICGTQEPICVEDGSMPGVKPCCNVDSDGNGRCGFQCIADNFALGVGASGTCCNDDSDHNGLCGRQGPVALPGACGSANNGTYASAPTLNLCSEGNASTISGAGPWTWTCTGQAGVPANCSANTSVSASIDTRAYATSCRGEMGTQTASAKGYLCISKGISATTACASAEYGPPNGRTVVIPWVSPADGTFCSAECYDTCATEARATFAVPQLAGRSGSAEIVVPWLSYPALPNSSNLGIRSTAEADKGLNKTDTNYYKVLQIPDVKNNASLHLGDNVYWFFEISYDASNHTVTVRDERGGSWRKSHSGKGPIGYDAIRTGIRNAKVWNEIRVIAH